MADPSIAGQERRVAFLAIRGLSEADIANSIRALDIAGIQADVIATGPPRAEDLAAHNSQVLSLERISPADYSALAIPASPDEAAEVAGNDGIQQFVESMQAAGKPILYIPAPNAAAGTAPATPEPAFSLKSLKKLWAESWRNWNAIDAPRLGAALAYYTLLSLAPLLVLIVSIAGVFFRRPLIQSGLIWQVRSLLGSVAAGMIRPVLENTKSSSGIIAGLLGVVTLLLGASGVFLELRDSLDMVWGVRPNYGSGLWSLVRARLFAFLMVLATGLGLSLSILLSVILGTPVRFLLRFVPNSGIVSGAMAAGFSIVIMALVFAVIYKVVPDIYIGWGDVWIGALVTSILFTAGKGLIGLYLSTAGVGLPYAAAGSLIVFLTWVYYSVQIFLLGAEFTHEYALRHGSYSRAGNRARRFWQLHRPGAN